MDLELLRQFAGRLLGHPTAPYHEHAARAEAERICAEHGLDFKCDPSGNLLVTLRTESRRRPLVLAAHLDHPGFEILRALGGGRWLARFNGTVPHSYFRPGVPVRLMPGAIPAKLGPCRDSQERLYQLQARPPIPGARRKAERAGEPPALSFAVWDLEDFAVRDGRVHARSCDDLIGAASVLATLVELKRGRARAHVIGVLSRAEEIGFRGALALVASGGLPKNALVISLETSRELPGVKMGQGVIIRVGDRTSIFDPAATRFLGEVAAELKSKHKTFQFQRGLMSGGTCEATAYQEFGWQSGAVCVALGNYHNCGEKGKIKAEFVSLRDAGSMVDLLVAVSRHLPDYDRLLDRLPKRLEKLLKEAKPRLLRTAAPTR